MENLIKVCVYGSVGILVVVLFGAITAYCWNNTVSVIFSIPTISMAQGILLIVLSRLLIPFSVNTSKS